jgi:hypothetical protein
MQFQIKNPFEAMHVDEVRCSKDALEEIKQELLDYVKTIADRNIEGFDVGEFGQYIDAAIHDSVDDHISLADDAISDATPYRDENAEHRLTHAGMGLAR